MESYFRSNLLRSDLVAGPGALAGLADWLAARRLTRPLVLAGTQVSRTAFFASVAEHLARSGGDPILATDAPSPATAASVEALAAHQHAQEWDGIVAVGGGSTIDAAKAIALLIARGGTVRDYAIQRSPVAAPAPIPRPARFLPLVAVPTTFSGSEANINASIRDPAAGERYSLADPNLLPSLIVLAPEGVRTHRPQVLLGSAFNALAHCIEGIYSPRHHPLADAQAETSGRLLCSVLDRPERVMEEQLLLRLQLGSVLAGALIREVYVGMHHAMCHSLVSLCGVLHAQANGAMLPWSVGFNVDALATRDPERLRVVAAALALPEAATPEQRAVAIRTRLTKMQAQARIPGRLSELGVQRDQLAALARYTLQDRALNTNPVPVDYPELLALFQQAF